MRILTNPNFNFIRWRWHALALSLAIILSGVYTVYSRGGLPLGVDFSGGSLIWLTFEKPTGEEAVRNALRSVAGGAQVQQIGTTGNQIVVRLPMDQSVEQGAKLEESAERVLAAVTAANLGTFRVDSKDIVGPVVGADLKQKGILATVTALGGILVYIGFRFRFSFAVGAIVATFHDLLVTLAMLTWFGYDISLNVIAALLTIAGYSVNDTIVVFDRVRENQRLLRKEPLAEVVNRSVNQTLARTIITAGTTFLAVVALFLYGGEVLRGLSFTLLVGIVTGTYSTVFIASAIAIMLSPRPPAQSQAQAKAGRT
jgi:preprotein translocase subunit SecF